MWISIRNRFILFCFQINKRLSAGNEDVVDQTTDPNIYKRTKRKIGGQKEVLNAWFCSYKTEIYHFDAVVHCVLFNEMVGSMKMMRKRKY